MDDYKSILPVVAQDRKTGLFKIIYQSSLGDVLISSLTWKNKDAAQKIADHILTKNPKLQVL